MLAITVSAAPLPPKARPRAEVPPLPPPPPSPQQQVEVKHTNTSEYLQTFEVKGLLYREIAYAHVYTHIDLNRVIKEYNAIVQSLEDAHKRVLLAGNLKSTNGKTPIDKINTFVNTSFYQLKEQVQDAQDELGMLCEMIACVERIEDPMLPKNASRKKRQVEAALGVVSVGLSIYTLAETEALKLELFSEAKEVDHLGHQLAAQEKVLSALEGHMVVVDRELHALAEQETRVQFEQSISLISAFLYRATERLLWFSRSLTSVVIEKRLGPRIFEVRALQRAVQDLEGKAKEKGMVLVSTRINDVTREHVSFVARRGIIYFMLHLPLGVGEALKLYRYVSVPFLLTDGKAARISSTVKLIAVNRQLDQKLELRLDELKSCIKRGANHLCKKGVVQKDITNSCLGALFMGQGKLAVDLCNINILNLTREVMVQTGDRTVVILTPPKKPPVHVYIACGDLDAKSFAITGSFEITVGHGCSISTAAWAFQASIGAPVQTAFTTRPLLEFKVPMEGSNLTNALEIEDFNPSKKPGEPKRKKSRDYAPKGGFIGSLMLAALVLFSLILAAAGYVIFRIKRADWKRRQARGRPSHRQGPEETEAATSRFKRHPESVELRSDETGLTDIPTGQDGELECRA